MTPRSERQRIERVVVEEVRKSCPDATINGAVTYHISTTDVINLLRRELAKRDARVRRIVNNQVGLVFMILHKDGKEHALISRDDLLAALRGKGKR